jgi:hypothetical protein
VLGIRTLTLTFMAARIARERQQQLCVLTNC